MLSDMTTQSDLIGSAEACRILGVHVSTLTRWVALHEVRYVHKLPSKNGAYLFDRAEIERKAAENAEQTA